MKKKKLLLPVLVFASIFTNVQTTQAMTIDEKGERWWTVDELIGVMAEAKEERVEQCGEDLRCQMNVKNLQMNRDSKYRAIKSLEGTMLMVTNINIAKNEITIFVNKEDEMRKMMNMPNVSGEVEVMELAWAEGDYSEHVDFTSYYEHIWGGKEIDGLHILYTFDKNNDNFPDKKETILKIKNANLSENKTNIIKVFIKNDNGSNATGAIDYGECINSADYAFGMDCKMIISENSRAKFIPASSEPENTIIDTPETSELSLVEESQIKSESSEVVSILTPKENVSELEDNESVIISANDNIDIIRIKAPDTGKYSGDTQKSSWQPLFLTVFIGILWGIVRILRKNQKKSKKV